MQDNVELYRPMANVIEIKNGAVYQNERIVLTNINLAIQQDEFIYLIGKTGSGKSSLLKMLYGELPLKEGTGKVAEFSMEKLKRKHIPKLRRQLGIVFQDFQLLTDRSIYKNLEFVMGASGWKGKKQMRARAEEVLDLVGLDSKIDAMPHALSGGEQQRVAVARALLNRPKIILADEPTGNLDPETSAEIMELLIAVAKEEKAAVVMATHDFHMMEKYPGRVFRVENKELTQIRGIADFNPFSSSI